MTTHLLILLMQSVPGYFNINFIETPGYAIGRGYATPFWPPLSKCPDLLTFSLKPCVVVFFQLIPYMNKSATIYNMFMVQQMLAIFF